MNTAATSRAEPPQRRRRRHAGAGLNQRTAIASSISLRSQRLGGFRAGVDLVGVGAERREIRPRHRQPLRGEAVDHGLLVVQPVVVVPFRAAHRRLAQLLLLVGLELVEVRLGDGVEDRLHQVRGEHHLLRHLVELGGAEDGAAGSPAHRWCRSAATRTPRACPSASAWRRSTARAAASPGRRACAASGRRGRPAPSPRAPCAAPPAACRGKWARGSGASIFCATRSA